MFFVANTERIMASVHDIIMDLEGMYCSYYFDICCHVAMLIESCSESILLFLMDMAIDELIEKI
jgi:hypothetical protein